MFHGEHDKTAYRLCNDADLIFPRIFCSYPSLAFVTIMWVKFIVRNTYIVPKLLSHEKKCKKIANYMLY